MATKWSIGLAALWLSVAAAAQSPAESSARRGERLFVGQEPLKGAIVGHDDALPAFASKCVNCHDPAASEKASYGSKLTPAALLEAAARRGGPPSRYEARSFCRLLRTGIDPAHDGIDVVALKQRGFTLILDAEEKHLVHSHELISALRRSVGEMKPT